MFQFHSKYQHNSRIRNIQMNNWQWNLKKTMNNVLRHSKKKIKWLLVSKVNLIDRGKLDISMWAFESSIGLISRKIHRRGSALSRLGGGGAIAPRGLAPCGSAPAWHKGPPDPRVAGSAGAVVTSLSWKAVKKSTQFDASATTLLHHKWQKRQ